VTQTERDGLQDVWLLNFPLDVYQRAQEHADGLLREFALIALDRDQGNAVTVPARLLAIVDELGQQYQGVGTGPEAERDAAIDSGATAIDLHYRVPSAVAEASAHLGEVFDEADAYCSEGGHLLSLKTPPEALAFRRWFLAEFIDQTAGAQPTPWVPPESTRADAAGEDRTS
jgi:hypothetical protein